MGLEKKADEEGYDVEMLKESHERHEARLRQPGFSHPYSYTNDFRKKNISTIDDPLLELEIFSLPLKLVEYIVGPDAGEINPYWEGGKIIFGGIIGLAGVGCAREGDDVGTALFGIWGGSLVYTGIRNLTRYFRNK